MVRTLTVVAVLLFALNPFEASSQVGGRSTYAFLKLPPTSRITALGGTLISVRDDDLGQSVLNPAMLNDAIHGSMTFQSNFHFDGIYNGYAAYGHHFADAGITGHAGIQFMQYGKFTRADEFGNIVGDFKASEMALTVGAAQDFGERFSAGVNMRFIYSNFDAYNSTALGFDIGGSYFNDERRLVVGLVVRNVGFQLSKYDDVSENLPLDIQLGFSKKLKYLPFRLSITAHSLNRWDLRYDSPLADDGTSIIGEEDQEKSDFNKGMDNFFRHMIFSGEFLLGKKEVVKLRFAYNHQRRKELTVGSLRSFAGFSLGIGIKIKQFTIDYGFGTYHIAGSTQHIGISTNLSRFKKEENLLD